MKKKHFDVCLSRGAFWINATSGEDTALFTVRGKDHDLTVEELEELSEALHRAALLLASAQSE